jgi:hypothetical protein
MFPIVREFAGRPGPGRGTIPCPSFDREPLPATSAPGTPDRSVRHFRENPVRRRLFSDDVTARHSGPPARERGVTRRTMNFATGSGRSIHDDTRTDDRGPHRTAVACRPADGHDVDPVRDRRPHPGFFGRLAAHGLRRAGAPFLRHRALDMPRTIEVEAGVLASVTERDGEMFAGVLPAGPVRRRDRRRPAAGRSARDAAHKPGTGAEPGPTGGPSRCSSSPPEPVAVRPTSFTDPCSQHEGPVKLNRNVTGWTSSHCPPVTDRPDDVFRLAGAANYRRPANSYCHAVPGDGALRYTAGRPAETVS